MTRFLVVDLRLGGREEEGVWGGRGDVVVVVVVAVVPPGRGDVEVVVMILFCEVVVVVDVVVGVPNTPSS